MWPKTATSQNNDVDFCVKQKAILENIDKFHYQPVERNQEWMESVLELMLAELDPDKTIFTLGDCEQIKTFIPEWHERIATQECVNIENFISLYDNASMRKAEILSAINARDMDFSDPETLGPNLPSTRDYFTLKDLQQYLKKRNKLGVLFNYAEKLEDGDTLDLASVKDRQRLLDELNKEEECENENSEDNSVDAVGHAFLNALLQSQDLHSSFFTVQEKSDFERSVATDERSFGIYFTEAEIGNNFVVAYFNSTGMDASDSQPEIDDELVWIELGGGRVEMECMDSALLNDLIQNTESDKIKVRLKRSGSPAFEAEIPKRKLPVASNFLRGYRIDQNYGYLAINSFYTDLDVPMGLGVANDAAAEIYKLQKNGLGGLILDLRGNGGGSLKEAVDLAGLFINRGPVGIIDERTSPQPVTAMDLNRGAAYTGPLVVLVDGYSASASELFAATMKDYNRAVIVGQDTYGKSTMQNVKPLTDGDNLNFVRLTIGAFYNVTGGTSYGKGVIPHVKLPAFKQDYREYKHEETTMKLPKLEAARRFRPGLEIPVNQLQSKSKTRVAEMKEFADIIRRNQEFKRIVDTPILLTAEGIASFLEDYANVFGGNSATESTTTQIEVSDHSSTTEILKYNELDQEYNTWVKEQISQDAYIIESLNILKDLIELK
jgi:carboxyl-terminal processing protease